MKEKKPAAKDFLLEIGCEELPAAYIPPAITQLRVSIEEALKESRLDFEKIESYATPVRMVICVRRIAARQESRREKISGPSK